MKGELVFSQFSNGIRVTVVPRFLEDESNPNDNYFAWNYTVVIENRRRTPIKLVNRHWRIYDSNGRITEVHGPGVVGQQPIIEPNEAFQYTSSAQLQTGFGMMVGGYEMVNDNERSIEVVIPPFSLDSPFGNSILH